MKLILTPTTAPGRPHWSVERTVQCFLCSAVMEVEPGDATPSWAVRSLNGDQAATVTCPHCAHQTEIRMHDTPDGRGWYPSHSAMTGAR